MGSHVEWASFAVNLAIRLVLVQWELPRFRLPLPEDLRNEAFEQFAAHTARQVLVTWPALALLGVLAIAAKKAESLTGVSTIILVFTCIGLVGLLLTISHDRFRGLAPPYVVVVVTTSLDLVGALFGWEMLAAAMSR